MFYLNEISLNTFLGSEIYIRAKAEFNIMN